MTKEVLIRISGLHQAFGEMPGEADEAIEVIVPGTYYYKNKKHYILYEEIEENGQITKNQLKIYDDTHVELRKSGILTATMVFETGQKHASAYQTPFGQMQLAMDTRAIEIEETEERLTVGIDYCLEVNHDPVADCRIEIIITSKQRQTN